MSQSPPPVAGPSSLGKYRPDGNLLRSFVESYLQQHGFDKTLSMFQQAFAAEEGQEEDGDGAGKENGDAGPSGAGNAGRSSRRRPSAGGPPGGKEAIFRAPEAIGIDNAIKRNIPQAQSFSASVLSDRITPDFEAQAKYIIDALVKKADGADGADEKPATEKGDLLLDPSDRIEGYKRYRRWVDDMLDMWKPELDSLSFPLLAYTYLDLIQAGFTSTARQFLDQHSRHHREQHAKDLASLSSLGTKHHLEINPYCQRLLREKYTVVLSRNSHDLLLQWLSGAGLDEEWEMGRHSVAGRAKSAVNGIIVNRIRAEVLDSSSPVDPVRLAAGTGLRPTLNGSSHDTPSTQLKLGPAPVVTEKLKEQVNRTLQEEEAAAAAATNGDSEHREGKDSQQNGHDANGDVDMERGSRAPTRDRSPAAPAVPQVKLELDMEKDSTLVSPAENETLPPIPGIFRIADLKREVEAVRDRRKMIRLGASDEGKSSSPVLPSVLAMTVFDGGEKVSSVEFSPDSSIMAVGSTESSIRLWSLKGEKLKAKAMDNNDHLSEDEGVPMRKLVGHSGPVYSLSFDPVYGSARQPTSLLSSSQDGTVRLWSLDTFSNLVAYRGHGRDPVWDVEWGPMGVYFASASRDRTAKLWSSDRVTPLRMYTGHLSDVNCVRFHPNSLYLATGSSDDSCRLWDVQRGGCIRLFLGHTDAVTTLAFSPDGRTLASAGLDSNIWLWDLGLSRPIKKMTGHRGAVTSLSFSAESSVLVSSSLDSTVRCWDVKSAGGEKSTSMRVDGEPASRRTNGTVNGIEMGELPLGGGTAQIWDGSTQTSDLLATFPTKRTPVIKTHYTPRNLCMVAGSFVPPSNADSVVS